MLAGSLWLGGSLRALSKTQAGVFWAKARLPAQGIPSWVFCKWSPISHSYSEGPARCSLNSIRKETLLEYCPVRKKAKQSGCQELHTGEWREILRNILHHFFSTCESSWMMCVRCFPQESKSQNSYLMEMSPEQHYFIFWAIWLLIIIMMR